MIKNTFEKWMAVVEKDGSLLEYVPKDNKTYIMCLKATKQYPDALKFVPKRFKSIQICFTSVKQNGIT